MEPKNIKRITGWGTKAEYEAYEKGREDESKVWVDFISTWNGDCLSHAGEALYKTFQRLEDKDFFKTL